MIDPEEKIDREAWEPIVAAMLSAHPTKRSTQGLLGLLGDLLAADQLPHSGRHYLAAAVKRVAAGEDPLPRSGKRSKYTDLDVMVAVERERLKRGATCGDMKNIHSDVAKRMRAKAGTIEKKASAGRHQLRHALRANLAAGAKIDTVVRSMAQLLRVPIKTVCIILDLTAADVKKVTITKRFQK